MSKNWEILTEYLDFIFFNALTLALNRRKPRAPCCAWSKREKWTVMLSSALPILLCQIVFGKKYRLQLDCKCQEITWKLLPCLTEGKKGRDWMDSISKLYIQGNIKTQMNLVILLVLGRLGRKCDFGKVFFFWGCFLHGQKMYLKVETWYRQYWDLKCTFWGQNSLNIYNQL